MISHDGEADWFVDTLTADSAVDAHREIERLVREAGWVPDPRDRQVTRLPDGQYSVRVRVTNPFNPA